MRAVVYTLTLREPLLATSLQGDPNSSVSLGYVPGSLVRGALIQHYLRKHPELKDALLDDDDARRLFIDGGARYLHAYPLTDHGQRALPTPRSLLRRKHDELDPNDATSMVAVLDASHPECGAAMRARFERPDRSKQPDTLKPLGVPFCASTSQTFYTYRPDRTIAVHIQRQPVKGRSLRGDGEVFRYDALAPEQQFRGVVLADADADATAIEAMLKELGTCWLGRSRSAHYGKTSIGDVSIEEDWRECDRDDANVPELAEDTHDPHSLTFLSDALLRDFEGQPVTALNAATLAAYLGLDQGTVTIDDERSFSATSAVGGFNRYWKLPLAQEYALAAGSVISFWLAKPLSADAAAQLEHQGIGVRRAEGFGRVAFNWRGSLEREMRKGVIARDIPIGNREVTTKHATTLAQRMARQLYERSVEQHIVDFVRDNPIANAPENSQIGRLRTLVRQALPTADVEFVRARYADFKSTAKGQYERARMGNESFDEWITRLLSNPDQVQNHFDNFQVQQIAGQNAQPDNHRMTLQLLAAVLAAPTRDQREQEGQP